MKPFPIQFRICRLVCWILWNCWLISLTARAGGNEVVVVYNSNLPASRDVAEYYARKRDVPSGQLIGLSVPDAETNRIERASFVKRMVEPLIRELSNRKLMEFRPVSLPATNGRPARMSHMVTTSKVRYLLLCYGLPYFIPPDFSINGFRDEGMPTNTPVELLRNQASVDAELVLLPVYGAIPFSGAFPNPAYGETNVAQLHPTNGVMLVSRLDGPTPELAKGLVDKAIAAERDGLNGRAYFDLRNITSGNYKLGDDWIGRAAEVAEAFGYETYVDHDPANLPVGFPLSEVALYAGWYSMQVDGPFTRPTVEFMPGAIAYHLFSFSASNPRDAKGSWVGALIAKGATVTLGCVDEPYLTLTPDIGLFFDRLAYQQMSVGEAALACQPGLSWQNLVIGDPLYRPWQRDPIEMEEWFKAHPSPLLAWCLERKVNLYQRKGMDRGFLRRYLMQQPLATNGPVISEKIATLAAEAKLLDQACEWARVALNNGATPQQRVRLYLHLIEWQRDADPDSALASFEAMISEFPEHPDILEFRKNELKIATNVGRKELVTKLANEVSRLTVLAEAEKAAAAGVEAAKAEASKNAKSSAVKPVSK